MYVGKRVGRPVEREIASCVCVCVCVCVCDRQEEALLVVECLVCMNDVVVWSVGSDNSRQLPLLRDAVTLLRISGELGGGAFCFVFILST